MNLPLNSIAKNLHYGQRLRPARDWAVLLVLFLVALAISLAYNLLTFSHVTRGELVGNAVVVPSTQIQLDQVKNLFGQRSAERARYTSDYRFVDPSL